MRESLRYTVAPEDKVLLRHKFAYCLGTFPDPIFCGVVGGFLTIFYNSVLGISATVVGFALVLPRLWDAVIDPSIGSWSDRCKSRFGRRRPFILVGGLVMCLAFALLFLPPPLLTGNTSRTIYLLVMAMVFFTGYTTYSIPYGALGIELSPDYKERNSVMAMRNIVSSIGTMMTNTMPWLVVVLAVAAGRSGDKQFGYGAAAIVFAVVSACLIALSVWKSKERNAEEVAATLPFFQALKITLSNRLFLRMSIAVFVMALSIMTTGAYSNYLFLYYLNDEKLLAFYGFINGGLSIPMTLVWMFLANRIGRPHALFLSQVFMLISTVAMALCFSRSHPWLILIPGALSGIAWAGVLVLLSGLLADITDLDELTTGERREGSYTGVYCFIFKLAIAASQPVLGIGVDWAGFVPALGVDQSSETFLWLRLLTGVGGGVFALIALGFLWRFPLTPERAIEARHMLEERRGKVGAVR